MLRWCCGPQVVWDVLPQSALAQAHYLRADGKPTAAEPVSLVGAYAASDSDASDADGDADGAAALSQNAAQASGVARMIHESAARRRKQEHEAREGASRRAQALKSDPKLAQFEQHSRGIGSRLLRGMGWQPGEGLGAKRSGISAPLQASMRPALAGLGAAGEEKGLESQAKKDDAAKAQKEGDSKAGGKGGGTAGSAFKSAWQAQHRKKAAASQKFKTAEEVLAEREAAADSAAVAPAATPGAAMTILDMTGPQTRVVTDLAQLGGDASGGGAAAAAAADAAETVPFPELQHNLKLLEELAEADIHSLVRLCDALPCAHTLCSKAFQLPRGAARARLPAPQTGRDLSFARSGHVWHVRLVDNSVARHTSWSCG